MAAQPSLLAERDHVRIAPGIVPPGRNNTLVSNNSLNPSFSRNWYRIIHLHGLETLIGSKNIAESNRSEEAEKLWGLLIGSAQADDPYPDLPPGISDTFDLHLFDSRTRGTINPFLFGYEPFHITWFEIREIERGGKPEPSTWNTGILYGSNDESHIRETAFTIGYYPQNPRWWSDTYFPQYDKEDSMEQLVKHGSVGEVEGVLMCKLLAEESGV